MRPPSRHALAAVAACALVACGLTACGSDQTALTATLAGPDLRHVLDQAMDAARACVEALASASEGE